MPIHISFKAEQLLRRHPYLFSDPLCHQDVVSLAKQIVKKRQGELGRDLPDDHIWKQEKLIHGEQARVTAKALSRIFPQKTHPTNLKLVEFMAFAHDLGRPIEAKHKLNLMTAETLDSAKNHHGALSTEVLAFWGVLKLFPQQAREIVVYAITHHADVTTPSLPKPADSLDKQLFILTAVVRDIDKLAIFKYKTSRYLKDKVHKQGQIKTNNLDPRGEMNIIKPRSQLEQFCRREALTRRECRSYEAYMLQYLAWIYDVNFSETLRRIVESNAINMLLNYFNKQLPPDDSARIAATTQDYLESRGIKLQR